MEAERVSLKWDDKKEKILVIPDPEGMWLIKNRPRMPLDNVDIILNSPPVGKLPKGAFVAGIDPYKPEE